MNKIVIVFFELLRAGLWERKPVVTDLFPLSDREWDEVITLARHQTVQGLVFRGMQFLPDDMLPSQGVRLKLMVDISRIERRNIRQRQVLGKILATMKQEGLSPVLLKGQGVACMYANPLLRECGDIDMAFSDGGFKKAVEIVRKTNDIYSAADKSLHFNICGEIVELHAKIIDDNNPLHKSIIKKLFLHHGLTEIGIDGKYSVVVPNSIMKILMINMHILKHTLGWGIGLRQFCDLARTSSYYSPCDDYANIGDVYRSLGLRKWNSLLYSFLIDHLGMDEALMPRGCKRVDSSELLQMILMSGNFGMLSRERLSSSNMVLKKIHTIMAFMRRSSFALRYAPAESIFSFISLVKGQF